MSTTFDACEVNFDGLVGPTHNYAGLARGNLAAAAHAEDVSNPKQAALQGLAKMRAMVELGVLQAVLPPHERPHILSLRRMGFTGSDSSVLAAAANAAPALLANISSAAAMWTANAGTVSPSADAADAKVHLTPANLASQFHRALEAATSQRIFEVVFGAAERFCVHAPVPFATFGDEGAANHCRLAPRHGEPGLELFVYGRSAFASEPQGRFRARQTLEASHVVATTHCLRPNAVAFAQQAQSAVDAGVFHNDVASTSNERLFLFHADAFTDPDRLTEDLKRSCGALGFEPLTIKVSRDELPLEQAVASYLFNSQIVTLPDGGMIVAASAEVEETPAAKSVVDRLIDARTGLRAVRYFDLRQSMNNGGGPACLRLRVVLTASERASLGGSIMADAAKISELEAIVHRCYRDRLSLRDLADPELLTESRTALDEFSSTLHLGSIHDFQRG